MDKLAQYTDQGLELLVFYIPKIVTAILVLIVGLWIISMIVKGFNKASSRSNMDGSLQKFLSSLFSMALKVMLLISVISMLGIETTSFVAVLGAAGLAVGFALQGSLGNFAGGVLLLIFKPFKVGDFIDGAGHAGTVHSVEVLATTLKTPDNKTIIIPNGALSGSSITNFSTEPQRRVDFVFGIGYGDDMKKAKDIIKKIVDSDSRVLADPAPFIAIGNLGDSAVDITTRVWVNAADYWGVYFDTTEAVKAAFDAQNISIPFPQMDIHTYKEN
ncbi:MAG: mechanosensitive ion channel family protein [Calditrichaeota bacterium]|nr:MAG: mechanosensitive ion channel family protein [Calditrichota bacterium]MBL1206593.1 mechanosensitive ion channel family protein [Calditrichota bacterium]NOG46420.1 mechanosensitive ion channel [Calditrichota bacterium]